MIRIAFRPILRQCRGVSSLSTNTSPRPSAAEMKRFWKEVTVSPSVTMKDRWNVLLDGRKLRLPEKSATLELPTESLAMMVAAEWHTQEPLLKPNSLPITSIVARGLDTLNRETGKDERNIAMESLIKFLDTDSILYQQSYPDRLVQLQHKHWLPLIQWVNGRYGTDIRPTEGLSLSDSPVNEASRQKLSNAVSGYDGLKLAGFERAVITSKSFIIALALIEGHLTVSEAVEAARVEITSQTAVWGNVEEAHELELQFTRRQLASSVLFLFN